MPDCLLVDIGTTTHRHHPHGGRRAGAVGPDRSGAAPERRAGLYRRVAHAGRGGLPGGAAVGRALSARRGGVRPDRRRVPLAGRTGGGGLHRGRSGRPARRPASSPASGWPARSAPTRRCWTRRRSGRSRGRWRRPRSLLVADAVRRVHARHPRIATAVVTGLGDFIAAEAARRRGARGESRSPTGSATPRGPRRPRRSRGCWPTRTATA